MKFEQLDDLEQLKKDTTALIKAVKDVEKKSAKLRDMVFDASRTQRGKALNALSEACRYRDKVADDLHVTLVNLGLTPRLDDKCYETRHIEIANGSSGFSNTFKYQPKKPR